MNDLENSLQSPMVVLADPKIDLKHCSVNESKKQLFVNKPIKNDKNNHTFKRLNV